MPKKIAVPDLIERICCILRTPEIELDGEAYKGKYELNDVNSIQDFIDTIRLDANKRPKKYANADTGEEFIISGNSAGNPQIIWNMRFLQKLPMRKENSKYSRYLYYITLPM